MGPRRSEESRVGAVVVAVVVAASVLLRRDDDRVRPVQHGKESVNIACDDDGNKVLACRINWVNVT